MTSVFLFRPDADRYQNILYEGDDLLDVLDQLKSGRHLVPKREVVIDEGGREGDFPSLDLMIPVFTPKAYELLMPLLPPATVAQLLEADGAQFIAVSVPHIVDCLDRKNTKVALTYGLTAEIEKIHLKPDRIDGAGMFRIDGIENFGVFVSGAFMDVVKEHRLRGLERVKVWPKKK